MKLHDGHLFTIAKRVNNGHWLTYGSASTYDEAMDRMERGQTFHTERCPNDRVEWNIHQVY